MLEVRTILEKLRGIIDYHNDLDPSSSYGLVVNADRDSPIQFQPSDAAAHTSIAERAIGQLDSNITTQKLPLPEAGEDQKSLYLWRLGLRSPAPTSILWSVSPDNDSWTPFFPGRFTELGQLCTAYLDSCYSGADAYYLIGEAFEAGASKLALQMMQVVAKADSAILWLYHPEAHYFRAETIIGAASGLYITGVGKGIVGQLSTTNRHLTVDTSQPGSLLPFHPDLFLREGWVRIQYAAICSEGSLLGAIGLYWRSGNRAKYLTETDALRMASLATVMLAAERAELMYQSKLDSLEQLMVRLAPAQALISFMHDVQRSLRDVTTAMATAAVLLDQASSPQRKALAAQLSRSADFIDGCMNRMGRLALLREKVANHRRTDLQLLLHNMRPLLVSHSAVKVSVEAGQERVWIRADRLAVERAILNVVTNAVYWTEAKLHGERRVRVRLSHDHDSAIIDVEDTGLGIGAEVRDRIFDKFVSGRPESGTGMGLFIVKETLESHGGKVSFFPNRDQGTTFRLAFPLLEAA